MVWVFLLMAVTSSTVRDDASGDLVLKSKDFLSILVSGKIGKTSKVYEVQGSKLSISKDTVGREADLLTVWVGRQSLVILLQTVTWYSLMQDTELHVSHETDTESRDGVKSGLRLLAASRRGFVTKESVRSSLYSSNKIALIVVS